MALTKNALIRYKTIDKCLQNSYRTWTLANLVEACSDALYEYEGRDVNVSIRTVQLDIQHMRSDKLGYNAPIEVYEKKFYRYSDPDYTITNIPLTDTDMQVLTETVEMLGQFKSFSLFGELSGIIQRLEDKIYTEKTERPAIIHLDKNDNLKGLEHLDSLYQSILKQICLNISYQSFKSRESMNYCFHPYILKQFNNRWFIVGRQEGKEQILTLALDRIVTIDYNLDTHYNNGNFDSNAFYKNTYGVTVLNEGQLMDTTLKIDATNAPYVLTKPFHPSQELIEQLEDGSAIITLRVDLNYEFERLILGFGDSIEVIKPRLLRNRIKGKLKRAHEMYLTDKTTP